MESEDPITSPIASPPVSSESAVESQLEADVAQGDESVTRSQSVWMHDGNIILQAATTQFCVHQSMLEQNSAVFRDMFAVAQADDPSQERDDGRPVVHLSDIPAHLEHFLRAIYNRRYFTGPKIGFDVLEGILRMSIKYVATDLRNEARDVFRHDFPDTLAKWDALTPDKAYGRPEADGEPLCTWHNPAVSLARDCNVLSALPLAFFRLVRDLDLDCIYNLTNLLSAADILACIVGKERMRARIFTVYKHLTQDSDSITSCDDSACDMYRISQGLWLARCPHKELVWRVLDDDDLVQDGPLCPVCAGQCARMFASARAAFWLELPSFFGLPSWEELRRLESLDTSVEDTDTNGD